jgi:hypothetical protein
LVEAVPKLLFHYCSNKWVDFRRGKMETGNQIKEMRIDDNSPEKAGVGGSIPSLATIFSNTYNQNRLYAINGGGLGL